MAVAPVDGATDVATVAPVVIAFSRPIEANTLVFTASPDPGGWSVSWDRGATVATLTHNPFGYWRTYDVTVTAASDPLGNPLAGAPYAWSFATGPYRLHFPLVLKRFAQASDLVVDRTVASSHDGQVVIKNQGSAPSGDGFWLDIHADPDPIPTAVNPTWNYVGDEGLVWGVTTDLQPGDVLTLTASDDHYVDAYGHVAWPLAAGAPVSALVDSVSANTTHGVVLESRGITGREYKNIGGPEYPVASGDEGLAEPPPPGHPWPGPLHNLPPRR